MTNGNGQEGPCSISAPQKSQWANNKCIWMLRLLPGRKSAVKIFQNSDPFPEFSSHVIDSLFSVHLKHYLSVTSVCGWVLLRIKSAKGFYLNFIFLDVFDRTNRTRSVFATGKHRLICSKIWYIHHWNFVSR